ncbi:MAG TPA: twin-arginine translocase TatA/TatE family subunit [Anaerolineales bacterium]|nr:twin-arginine translocase TatA/TatE family subunit [Anaerolineales bacterium]HRQ91246.1 twin-arginine translocase TatA/TatE family subunit [Anaerolineales bacterium]
MQFLGISPTELVFIVIILFLVLGPQDLVKVGSTLGRTIRKARQSGAWQTFTDATRQLRELPQTLARQAGVDELEMMGREIGAELKEQREKIEELDRQFVAWTRTPQERTPETPTPSSPDDGAAPARTPLESETKRSKPSEGS